MKILVWLIAFVLLGVLSVQLYHLYSRSGELSASLDRASAQAEQLAKDNQSLQADLIYFAAPENLAKELKARFDYKKPGEKMIKIQ